MGDNVGSSTSLSLLGRLRLSPTDPAAWNDFAARYGPQIRLWCRQWKMQDADAQDLAQTVLAILLEKMRAFVYDPSGSFRAWLKTVTRNAWFKYLGKCKRAGVGSTDNIHLLEGLEAADSLEAHLEAEYDRELLELATVRVAQRVEPHTLEAFRLMAVEGKSGADAAAKLGMKVAAVYVARKRVQDMLREEIRNLDE